MNSRGKRRKTKQWRINTSAYREKKEKLGKRFTILLNETPPASPVIFAECSLLNREGVIQTAIGKRTSYTYKCRNI